jgi:hypothetical protein
MPVIGYARWTVEQKDAQGETEQANTDLRTEGADVGVAPSMDGFTWTPRDLEPWGLAGIDGVSGTPTVHSLTGRQARMNGTAL